MKKFFYKIRYYLKRMMHKWRKLKYDYNFRRLYVKLDDIKIDRPIFLLGLQGGGLSIIAKALQRHKDTFYCYGNRKSWDSVTNEMYTYLEDPDMPEELSFLKNSYQPTRYKTDHFRCWTYALDDTIDIYRLSEDKLKKNPDIGIHFRKAIKKSQRAYAGDINHARFIDKSQLFTINVLPLYSILRDSDPYFVMILRNPYAMCKRNTENYFENPYKHNFPYAHEKNLELSCQHWRNSYNYALKDSKHVSHFKILKFEDFLRDPEQFLRHLCDFTDLEFSPDIVPGPDQKNTIYNQINKRWYPIRKNSNRKYLQKLTPGETEIITRECGDLIDRFNYSAKPETY